MSTGLSGGWARVNEYRHFGWKGEGKGVPSFRVEGRG